jgi:chorismate dehydratase
VRSVLLRCRLPVHAVRVVAADPASRTSNLLAQLVLRARFGSAAVVRPRADARRADAAVVIGDRALAAAPERADDIDLAAAWKAMTGLPFVFAAWTCLRGHARRDALAAALQASLETGLAAAQRIAARFARRLHLRVDDCRDYLDSCVYFSIRERERQAIAAFARLLKDHGLPAPASTPAMDTR